MSIREGGTTKINSLATKIKGLISTHETKTGSSLQKGHVQAGGAPQTIGKTLSAGTDNGYYARADHVHTVDFSNILNTPDALDVIDNTTTDDGTKPLSAKQGKILNDKKVAYMGIDDELNLYIGYDPITDIILTANKSIFQKNESVTFTATAKNGNTLLESVPVLFYNGNNYLGTSVTNSNGIATYNYTGVGAGKINTIAKNCSVVSQPYPVTDCIKYDKGNTANTIWTTGNNNNAQLDLVDNSYRKLSEITTGTDAWVYLKIAHSCVCEFDVQVITTDYTRSFCQYGQTANATTRANIKLPPAMQSSNWHHIKLSLQNGVVTMTSDELSNPVTYNLSSYDATMDMYFRFRTDTEITEISFKEFEYYPI